MKATLWIFIATAVLSSGFLSGCGNADGTVTLDKSQTSELVKKLGTYEGAAQPRRIMGAMMTGIWTANFFQDEAGVLKCKCSLRLHDGQNGWGRPTTSTVNVQFYRGPGDGQHSLKAEGRFSDGEPSWMIPINGVSLTAGHAIDIITLFDMDSYEIKLQRK